jgi:Aspartyl/Asparaginyl beta-hydroxylase
LTSHLAIDIPNSGQNKCRLSVGSTEKQWINGEVSLFDTSIMHEAVNESDQVRYILMMRVWHPDLTSLERQALQFTYDALECPEIVTGNTPEQRDSALRKMNEAKEFPVLKKGKVYKGGFGGKIGNLSSNKKSKK